MKAKMTGYQDGGKMPIDPKKAQLARKLFGEMPGFDKNKFRKEMMGEKINKLQKEYDYWTKKGEPTAASGVKVQMDKIREDMKKYAGGGKMPKYEKGGAMKVKRKKGVSVDYRGRKFDNRARKIVKSIEDSMAAKAASEGISKVDYESTLDVSNENGVSKTNYRSVGNISDDRGKSQRIVENSDGKTNTYYARKSNPTQPVKVGPSSPSKIMAGMNGRGYRDIEREVRPGISNAQSVSDLEKAKKMMYQNGGKMKKYLMGGQVKLDKNKDGKISAIDFKMLKKK